MKIQKRRRKENKTDYQKRIKLLKSGIPRIVFRKTDKYLISQYISSKEAQDKIVLGFNSKELIKYGWPEKAKNSIKNISASYLTGYIFGKKILGKKLKTPIMDIGMIKSINKSKIYAFVKGVVDSGIELNYEEKIFPEDSRIKGTHLKNKIPFEEIKLKIEKENNN